MSLCGVVELCDCCDCLIDGARVHWHAPHPKTGVDQPWNMHLRCFDIYREEIAKLAPQA